MLFGEYPENFFAILHCKNQTIYAEVLLRLYTLFYGTDAISQPLRDEAKGIIAGTLEQKAVTEWDEELKGDDREREDLDLDETGYRSHLIYKRLIECGWIEEERDNNFRDIVSMPSCAASLLHVFKDISMGRRVSYAGYVGNVYLNLDHVRKNPQDASFLKEARRNSEELQKKLQELQNSVKVLIRQTKDKESIAKVLGHFFESYMENFFSSAYGRVKTVDNPFKYRHRIGEMLIELRQDRALLEKISASYNGGGGDRFPEVLEDLDVIYSVFSKLDDLMAGIDMKKEQYERIVKERIRYFETGHGDIKASIAEALKSISAFPEAAGFISSGLKSITFLDSESLAVPRKAKRPLEPQRVANSELADDDYLIERLKSARRIAMSVGRGDVKDFIDMMLDGRHEILGSKMESKNMKELVCMMLSKYLAYDMPSSFDVDELERETENRYLVFNEFRIGKRIR